MNPYDPTYIPAITHMQDLQRDAAAARLVASAGPRRPRWATVRSAALRLRSLRTRVVGPAVTVTTD